MGKEEKLERIAQDARWEISNRFYPWIAGKDIERVSNAAIISLVMSLAGLKDRIVAMEEKNG